MKSLYLLHGYCGSDKDWILGSSIQEMSQKYNIAVIMPCGDNSFYLDRKGTGNAYCQYVGKELVEYVVKTFGLSEKKEDTYIGGFSMGGFGALHTAFAFPETFGKIVALSSALIIHNIENLPEDFKNPMADYYYYASVFGDLNHLEESLNNPEYQIRKLKENKQTIPSIFMACGTEDFLLKDNRAFHSFLQEEKVAVEYIESPGVHNWDFWNGQLEPSIKWLLS
jgi:S-formylglutathione hydrolase FrmB